MSMEIYFFSGTGNSLHVAKELQKRIPEAKLIPMVSLLNNDVIETNGEMIGFVFPTYLSTIPVPVKNFLQKLALSSAKYIFAIATRENSLCLANIRVEKILKKKGKSLNASFILNMVGNSPTSLMPAYMPGLKDKVKNWVNLITKEKIAELESEVQHRLNEIQKVIINKENYLKKNSFQERFMALLMTPADYANEHSNTEIHFYTDSTTCTGCGTCEKVCLSKKVKIIDKKPVWQKEVKCFYCYACFNCCPAQSILVKDAYTAKNGRYLHPGVTAHDIAGQK